VLRTINDEICQTFYEAFKHLRLTANQDEDTDICMQDAIDMNRPPNHLRFLLAQLVCYGAHRERLEYRFGKYLGDEDDNFDSNRPKINLLFDHDAHDWCDSQEDHQVPPTSPPESVLSLLTE
jgi:hypothetical protein